MRAPPLRAAAGMRAGPDGPGPPPAPITGSGSVPDTRPCSSLTPIRHQPWHQCCRVHIALRCWGGKGKEKGKKRGAGLPPAESCFPYSSSHRSLIAEVSQEVQPGPAGVAHRPCHLTICSMIKSRRVMAPVRERKMAEVDNVHVLFIFDRTNRYDAHDPFRFFPYNF
jgi:hypothetical protein